jgi:uncharacterized protein YqeY
MALKQQIDQDLKAAMLAGDKTLTTTLRGLKSAILNMEIAQGSRDSGLSEVDTINVLAKESKKRQESADLYVQGGNQERADAELQEKSVIERYLPRQISEEDLIKLINQAITDMGANSPQQMGQVIGAVKQKAGASADGGTIARLVKEKLQP